MKSQDVIKEVESYLYGQSNCRKNWYVGITAYPEKRLFLDHNVKSFSSGYKCWDCGSDTIARFVEKHFIEKGCDGGSGGGDRNSRYFYVYRKTAKTLP
ncbi:MAG TPA: hypothetical protein PLQ76_02740 [bacterium]|nr:hypothetical protein [bacterium]